MLSLGAKRTQKISFSVEQLFPNMWFSYSVFNICNCIFQHPRTAMTATECSNITGLLQNDLTHGKYWLSSAFSCLPSNKLSNQHNKEVNAYRCSNVSHVQDKARGFLCLPSPSMHLMVVRFWGSEAFRSQHTSSGSWISRLRLSLL